MAITRKQWNRQPKRHTRKLKDVPFKKHDPNVTQRRGAAAPYEVKRVRPRKRKPKHKGYTVMLRQRLGIFESTGQREVNKHE